MAYVKAVLHLQGWPIPKAKIRTGHHPITKWGTNCYPHVVRYI